MKRIPVTLRWSAPGRGFLPVVAGLVSLAALLHFVFWPLGVRLKSVDRKNEVREKVLEDLIRLTGSSDDIVSEFSPYAQYVQGGFSQEEQEGAFLKQVETIARTSAVQIVKQQPYVAKSGGDFLDIDLQIELEAPLHDIISFLYSIDNSDDLMRVMKMRLIPIASGDALIFRCQVEISKRYIR